MRSRILQPTFFDRPTSEVAKDLLGKYLVRRLRDPSLSHGHKTVKVMITEVEVYDGFRDRASHASQGRTKRNSVMFGPSGYWYAYFTRNPSQNPSARDMSQFRHNQEATTKVYRSVRRGGVTQSVSKLAISLKGCGGFTLPPCCFIGNVAPLQFPRSALRQNKTARNAGLEEF